ncbi:MAG TPA: DedA family protein [Methylomusa anaerophila]|uniref:Inner membrane protein YghB n=1 Tax=Methylomusa anaerophila TaxID=1930071 RepID=A0A348ANB4_9FIRM|nr:DedA family protein [Methylomusa anaerophila]BBB92562.1 inner membrane protein YghB [Methylomusa anaerophila]HML87583.1 DedA family protein [Methylomusa anaerophila]
MEQFYALIIQYINVWGYAAIIVGMAMESACLPVPSELIFGFAGYLVFLGRMDFTTAVIAGVVGGLLGSVVSYLAGYYGGKSFAEKYGRYIFLSRRHVDSAQQWFDRYGLKAVFLARLLPVVRTFISLPAGFAHVPFSKFVFYTVLGSIPWTTGLIYAGMLLGENWHKIEAMGHSAALLVGLGLVIMGILWLRRHRGEVDAS